MAHTSGLIAATRRILAVCLPFAPFAVIAAVLVAGFAKGPFLYDFHGGLYGAGRDIVHGHSPYRPGFIAQQAAVSRAGGEPATIFSVPVYPPPALIAVVPLALLPYKLAGLLWIAASVGALLLTLRLLGVVDRRCYALAFASWPIVHGLLLGAVTPFLCLCTAVAWRYRKRALVAGGAVAAVAVAKLFLWPLAVWLVFQRRLRAAGFALLVALGSTLAAWAAISFAGFTIYPRMLANLAYVSESAGVSLVAGLMRLGADEGPARVAALTAALLLLLASARLGRNRDDDRRVHSRDRRRARGIANRLASLPRAADHPDCGRVATAVPSLVGSLAHLGCARRSDEAPSVGDRAGPGTGSPRRVPGDAAP